MKKLLISFGPSPSTSRGPRAGLGLQGGGGVGQRRWPAKAGPTSLDAHMHGPCPAIAGLGQTMATGYGRAATAAVDRLWRRAATAERGADGVGTVTPIGEVKGVASLGRGRPEAREQRW